MERSAHILLHTHTHTRVYKLSKTNKHIATHTHADSEKVRDEVSTEAYAYLKGC